MRALDFQEVENWLILVENVALEVASEVSENGTVNVVSPTLSVNLTVFVILCNFFLDSIDYSVAITVTY